MRCSTGAWQNYEKRKKAEKRIYFHMNVMSVSCTKSIFFQGIHFCVPSPFRHIVIVTVAEGFRRPTLASEFGTPKRQPTTMVWVQAYARKYLPADQRQKYKQYKFPINCHVAWWSRGSGDVITGYWGDEMVFDILNPSQQCWLHDGEDEKRTEVRWVLKGTRCEDENGIEYIES